MGDQINQINGQQPAQEAAKPESETQVANKTYNKLDNLLSKGLDTSIDTNKIVQAKNDNTQDVNAIKSLASESSKAQTVVKSSEQNKTVISQAVQQTSSMAKLSEEALKLTTSGKIAGDIAQANLKTVTDNTKNTKVSEHIMGTEQAIRQDVSVRRKERVHADESIKGGSSQKKNTDTLETDMKPSKVFKKEDEEKLKAEVETSTDDRGQESKGKAQAEAKRKEDIEKKKEEKLIATLSGEKETHSQKATHKPPPQQDSGGANKLRAKFRKSSLHF
jgi:hypothetical protein